MKKRITAALLTFILLFSLLPHAASADGEEKIYQLGERTWTVGTKYLPTEKTAAGTMWSPYLNQDGLWESRPGTCPLQIHRHTTSCYDAFSNEICGKTEHIRHNTKCSMENAEYCWIVVVDPNAAPSDPEIPTPTDPTVPQGPGYSDPNKEYPAGSASFTVRNIDPDGKVLQDIEYYLLNADNVVMGNYLTNADGEIFFGGLRLRTGVDAEVWTLTQNPPMPDALVDNYEENRDKWNVTIVRNGDAFFISNIVNAEQKEENTDGETEENLYKEGYDAATGTVTVINQFKVYNALVTLKPILETEEGVVEHGIPEDLKVTITMTDPNGVEMEPICLPDGLSPQAFLGGLKAGTYTVTNILCENADMVGAVMGQPYAHVALPKPSENAENPILAQDYITIGSEYKSPDFWIYLPYKLPSSLTVRVMNDASIATTGSTVALLDGDTVIHEFNDENGYDVDLKPYAVEGKTMKYTLKQTEAPRGHHIAEEEYSVSVSVDSRDGSLKVSLKRDMSLLQNIASFFNGERAVIDSQTGNQLATFTNARKTTKIQVMSNVDMNFDEDSWQDDQILEQLRKQKNAVTLTWSDVTGATEAETVEIEDQQVKLFTLEVPLGASYKLEAADKFGFAPALSGIIQGTIGVEDVEEETPVPVKADWTYTVEPGEAHLMKMTVVDAENGKKKLAGVPFELQMEGVAETNVYGSDSDGVVRIRVSRPCSFTLEQKEAAEGYLKLETPIAVNVGIEYVAKEGSTKPVLVQKLAPVATHEAVEKLDDGSWLIKNTAVEVGEDVVDGYANKILIDVISESGSPVEGTQITMTCPNGDKKTYETGDIIDLEELGMVGSYSLQQTKSIAGHNIAEEKYAVTVSQKDGRYIVKVENIKLGLLDKIFGNNKIPHGPDGEWMMTFVNVRKTAKIELTCEVAMNFGAGTWHDLAFEKQCKEDTKYEFVLSWDDGHKREEEAATLVNGSKHNFDLEVPYGVEYRIVCLNEKGYFETSFPAGPKTWIIGDSELKETENKIIARNTYTIEPNPDADPLELHLVKVDATTKKPLEGVTFELLDSDDRKLASYTTGKDGKIDIVDTLKIGGSYGLKETEAVKGYEKPSAAFGFDVEAKYKLFTASGKPVLKQSFEAELSHKAIEKKEDGSYMIKNYKLGEVPRGTYTNSGNPKTGDSSDILLWSGMLVISMAAIGWVAADTAVKKRKMR